MLALYATIAAFVVALASLLGVFIFKESHLERMVHRFVLPLAIGVFLGVIFLELIPETLGASEYGAFAILAGFLGFYLMSHILSTYHHHHSEAHDGCEGQRGARMLLVGDAVHNFADGIVIASAFFINPVLGIATTIGIMLHEVPQEIAEYGVLIHSGYSKPRALFLNFCSALTIVVGVVTTSLFATFLHEYVWVITGVAAGNLLYIATSDFIPELRKSHRKHFYESFVTTLCGLLAIALLLVFSHEFIEQYEYLGGSELHAHD